MEIAHRFGALADKFDLKDRLVDLASKLRVMQAVGGEADPKGEGKLQNSSNLFVAKSVFKFSSETLRLT